MNKFFLTQCPFCGSPIKVRIGMGGLHFFYCRNETGCGAIVSFQGGPKLREAADPAANWNKRAMPLDTNMLQ